MFRLPRISGQRFFSGSSICNSNIGKQPVRLTEGVEFSTLQIPSDYCKSFTKGKHVITLDQQAVIKGPKGVLKLNLPSFVKLSSNKENIYVKVKDATDKIQRSMWGTARALIQNHVIGITDGHLAILRFVGTGYRALLEDDGKVVALKLGYPYTPKLTVPEGLKVTSPNPTRLLIEGTDKQQVKLFAARIREFKKPERYKGKGIFVDGETIQLKEKKIK